VLDYKIMVCLVTNTLEWLTWRFIYSKFSASCYSDVSTSRSTWK